MAFLAFEGLDGSGKSTLLKGLAQHLTDRRIPHVLTREPGGTALGEEIREWLLRTRGEAPSPRTELLLYEAGRAQHVDLTIRPALARKDWVLCDRFYASTVAFQCGGRGLESGPVEWLNAFAVDGCEPDLWVLVDVSVEEATRRLERREATGQGSKDRFELEHREFHRKVRDSYLAQARRSPKQWLVLDGARPPAEVLAELLKELGRRGWLAS